MVSTFPGKIMGLLYAQLIMMTPYSNTGSFHHSPAHIWASIFGWIFFFSHGGLGVLDFRTRSIAFSMDHGVSVIQGPCEHGVSHHLLASFQTYAHHGAKGSPSDPFYGHLCGLYSLSRPYWCLVRAPNRRKNWRKNRRTMGQNQVVSRLYTFPRAREWVSERASERKSAGERASEASSAEQANERVVRGNERTSERVALDVSIHGCSEPQCGGRAGRWSGGQVGRWTGKSAGKGAEAGKGNLPSSKSKKKKEWICM